MKNLDDQILVFLRDDQFIKWIHFPSEDLIAYWEKWMEEHPEDVPVLFKARQIARDLAYTESPAGVGDLSGAIWAGIQKKIGDAEIPHMQPQHLTPMHADPQPVYNVFAIPQDPGSEIGSEAPVLRRVGSGTSQVTLRGKATWYWMAASLLGLLILGAGIYYYRGSVPEIPSQHKAAELAANGNLDRINTSSQSQVLYLVDGSKVTLRPGSGIRHAAFLSKDKREVYLEGNAFFEVAKDGSRPFYVYTGDLVVKVLGTSFNVSTNRDNGDVTVRVRTGKVAVSRKPGGQDENGRQAADRQLILESNQAAFFKAQTRDLVQSVPDNRDLTAEQDRPVAANPFSFEETPVTKVFKMLEDAYGIRLHYDEKTFSGCVITTSLADETLDEKLKIVCEAIGAKYRIENNGIFIEGRPCKE